MYIIHFLKLYEDIVLVDSYKCLAMNGIGPKTRKQGISERDLYDGDGRFNESMRRFLWEWCTPLVEKGLQMVMFFLSPDMLSFISSVSLCKQVWSGRRPAY